MSITQLSNGAYRLRPEDGYILVHGGKEYSEAVVKTDGEIYGWEAKAK